MGADFVYMDMPFCKLTAERKAVCIAVIENYFKLIEENELYEEDEEDEAEESDTHKRRRQLIEFLDDYPTYDKRRDVCRFEIDYMGLSSGGFTWGDPPTDAVTMFIMVSECEPLHDQLVTYAMEDYRPILLELARKRDDLALGQYSPSTRLFIDLKDTACMPVSGTKADRLYALSAPLMEWVKRYETTHSVSNSSSSRDSKRSRNSDQPMPGERLGSN